MLQSLSIVFNFKLTDFYRYNYLDSGTDDYDESYDRHTMIHQDIATFFFPFEYCYSCMQSLQRTGATRPSILAQRVLDGK